MNRPVHFEIHSPDPDTSLAFFADVFGWKSQKWPGPVDYFLLQTGDDARGIDGGLIRSMDGQTRTVNTILVPDVDAHAAKVVAAGGKVVVPKMPIPGVGYLAYCTDPTGALFGITHADPSAK